MNKRKLFISIMAGFLAFILVFGLVAGVLPYFVDAAKASSSELKSKLDALKKDKKEIDAEIKELEGKLSDNLDKMEDIVEQKNTIDKQVFMLHEKITNLNEQIAAYGSLIADKQEELDAAQARLAELNQKNKERLRAMEEGGKLSYWSVLFKANDFTDLLDRVNMVEEIAAADQRRLQELSDAAKLVEDTKAALETEMAGLEENKATLKASETELEEKRKKADELLADLLATGEEYQKLLDFAESEASDLKADINATQDAYEAAKEEEESAKKPTNVGTTNAPVTGNWKVPCSYTRFSSPFGWRIHPVYKDWRFHKGVDLGAPRGTPIVASRSGTVAFATWNNSAGYYVKIDHGDGFASIYMHMTHYIVKAGDKVSAGQTIGYVGSTGTSTGNHLHFGITYKGNYVNPANYIPI